MISRSAETQSTSDIQAQFTDLGTELVVKNCDVSKKQELELLVKQCGNIRGIVQAAAVLQDSLFSNMTAEQWQTVLRVKARGSRNLDDLFQQVGELDFFIFLSSLTAVVGNVGQANYTAAGAYQDALAQRRVSKGLPAVSINIGSVPELGLAWRSGVGARLHKLGCRYQKRSDLLHFVELAITNPMHPQMVTGIEPWMSSENIGWREEPKFACSQRLRLGTTAPLSQGPKTLSTEEQISGLDSNAATAALVKRIIEQISTLTGMPAAQIEPDGLLLGFGVDSLVAVELRALLQQHVTPIATIFDIMQSGTLIELARKLLERLRGI